MVKQDTIAAISTAVSESGIGIIRISGDEAFNIGDKVCRLKSGRRLQDLASHTIHYGHVADPDDPAHMIDEVLISLFRAPRSYTAEDTVEINCHGGIFAMRKILDTVVHAGARPAEPGEFTKRAFLNGRIDLSQAEAVMDVIRAKNEYALKNSVMQVQGRLSRLIDSCRGEILYETAAIEAALDDPEHYSLDGFADHLSEKLVLWKEKILNLIRTAANGRLLQEGIQTAIVGKPNVGKSSLLNALSGEEKAIVTEIEGTTRDVLSQIISLGEFSLNLMDTAGIRRTDDKVETIGIERALAAADKADLVLWLIDSSQAIDDNDRAIYAHIKERRLIVLLNKTDLAPVTSQEDVLRILGDKGTDSIPIVHICASSGDGLDRLYETIRNMFYQGVLSFNDEVMITSTRQKSLLEEAYGFLENVEGSIAAGLPEDFYSIDLTGACRCLGAITGKETGEDLVNEIFEKFCMGK